MDNFRLKIRWINIKEVFVPYIFVCLFTVTFYAVFRWIFDFKLGVVPLKKDVLDVWFPFLIPWFPVLFWLRRRVKFLKFKSKNDDRHSQYQYAMGFAIIATLVASQTYLEKISFGLIELNHVDEIHNHKRERYFTIDTFKVDNKELTAHVDVRVTGKYRNDLNFNLYIPQPFEETYNIWYGIEFNKRISNNLNDSDKDFEYRKFLKNSDKNFDNYDFQYAKYFERLSLSDDNDGFLEAIAKYNTDLNLKEQIILVPKNDFFDSRKEASIFWPFLFFLIGSIIIFVIVVIPKFDNKKFGDFKSVNLIGMTIYNIY